MKYVQVNFYLLLDYKYADMTVGLVSHGPKGPQVRGQLLHGVSLACNDRKPLC